MSDKLHLLKVDYKYDDLSPVMSRETLEYHRDSLAAGYVKRYNKSEGDAEFNEAGAFLHNIFFPQLKAPSGQNNPYGPFLSMVEENYENYDNFKSEFEKVAMSIQGSGWVYLDNKGNIKTIKNHKKVPNIVLLIDWWEHAWALDYQSDKKKYLKNIWKIIDWDIVNDRINIKESSELLKDLIKISNTLDSKRLFKDADKLDVVIEKYASSKMISNGINNKNISQIDINTLEYIRDNYNFTDEAKNLFDKKLKSLRKKR